MKITIESTDKLTVMDGVPVRAWEGVTSEGVPCVVLAHRVRVNGADDTTRFDADLAEQLPPGRVGSPGTELEFAL